jgi:penicillin-binding protein 1B
LVVSWKRTGRRGVLLVALVAAVAAAGLGFAAFARRVHDLRTLRATGPSWVFPSRVYSSDQALVDGERWSPRQIVAQLRARGYRPAPFPLARPGTYAAQPGGLAIFLRGFLDAHDPAGRGGPERVLVRFGEGGLLQVERQGGLAGASPPDLEHAPRLEPVLVALLYDENRVRRSWVSIERVPQVVQDAVVAAEDRRFREHGGIDVRANLRALLANVKAGGVREGGSTITQQLARALFLGNERTVGRKLAEIPIALGLELLLDKRQILEMYLNGVYLGQAGSIGIGGVAEASRWYFDAPIDSLRLVEAATLAAIVPAPNLYDPFEHPAQALERRNAVLDDMVEAGRIPADDAARAKARPLGTRRGPKPVERHPSYVGYVREVLGRELPGRAAQGWGLDVFTTMDPVGQPYAEYELARRVGAMGRRLEGAFVAIDPATGAVRALVGGRAIKEGDFNRATQARRQTGSAIKPIVYAAAFGGGSAQSFTPATVVPDLKRDFGSGRWKWSPRNYDDTYHETVTLGLALARSLNVATSNLVEILGPATVARFAERFGLGKLQAVPSIGLGSNETTLLALTNAYGVFASGGFLRTPSPIRVVVDGAGRELLEAPEGAEQVLSPGAAALMTGLLQDVVLYGVGYPLRATYGFDRPVAGKTGTTNDFHDAWFVGYTPQLLGGVWVGFDRPRSLGRAAAHTAIPVWAGIMGALLRDAPALAFESDRDVQWSVIDPWTGFLADSAYCEAMRAPFIPGTAPTNLCHHGAYWDYAWGDLDSLYRIDSLYFADDGEPDTLEVTPAEPEADPELYADPDEPWDEPWDEPVEPEPEDEEGSADPAEPPVPPSGDEPGG